MQELLDKLVDQERLYCNEGRQGVINLCKVVRALGYKDPMYNMQLDRGAYVSDLLLFLEDNPGALEALGDWIRDQDVPEWKDNLQEVVSEDTDDE